MARHACMAPELDWSRDRPVLTMDTYAHRSEGAGRNFLVVLGIVALSSAITLIADRFFTTDKLLKLLTDLWYLGGLIGGAVCAVLYRLYTDTVQVAKLDKRQQIVLEQIVQQKSWRLWFLLALVLLPVGAAYVIQQIPAAPATKWVANGAFGVWIASLTFFFVYVPATWMDLRAFAVDLNDAAAKKDRAEKAIERLNSTKT